MRVTPVSVRNRGRAFPSRKIENQQVKNNNISFGNFESEEVKELTYKAAISSYANWSETKKKNFGFYDLDLKFIKENMGYLDNTNLATIKKWNGSDGKEYPYAALNRTETDRHENKELFNDIIKNAQYHPYGIEKEIIAKDPDFIGIIDNNGGLSAIRKELYNADNGIVLESSNNSSYTRPQEDDLWLEAVSREIHS